MPCSPGKESTSISIAHSRLGGGGGGRVFPAVSLKRERTPAIPGFPCRRQLRAPVRKFETLNFTEADAFEVLLTRSGGCTALLPD